MSVFLMHPITMFSYDKFGEEQILPLEGLSVSRARYVQMKHKAKNATFCLPGLGTSFVCTGVHF
jgi:hypothetical protein